MNKNRSKTQATILLAFAAHTRVSDLVGGPLTIEVREPDMLDDFQAHWIGEHAAVSVPLDEVGIKLGRHLDMSGWYARRNITPFEQGIEVQVFSDDTPSHPAMPGNEVYALWRLIEDTVLASSSVALVWAHA